MQDHTTIPKSIPEEIFQLRQEIASKNHEIDKLTNTVCQLRELVQQLRDEIAVLKGQKPRPTILPGKLNKDKPPSEQGSKESEKSEKPGKPGQPKGKPRKKKKTLLTIHNEVVLQPVIIPEGAEFKGYKRFSVQDIIFQTNNTRYLIAQYKLPDDSYITGELPAGIHGHYGPALISYALHQCNACRVTEPLLLMQLHAAGVLISSGQLSNILIKNKSSYLEEVSELLQAGVEADPQIQVDDTGGRHNGDNQYTTIISNQWFSVFTTTESKSRVNFLKLLQGGREHYLINEDTVAYLSHSNASSYIPGYIAIHKEAKFTTLVAWEQFLKELNITQANDVRFVTEAALFASLFEHGIPRDLLIHSDDAGQFDVVLFLNTLCWIHEERHYRKLIMTTDQARADLSRVRDQLWTFYQRLKVYKENPDIQAIDSIKKQFDEIFQQKTSSPTLNHQLQKTYQKKEDLLGVLVRPESPLHNNLSESCARSSKMKLKVSGGTRSHTGRDVRDAFLSLKQTCLKLGINFLSYLQDRVCGLYKIPRLAEIIRQRSALARSESPLATEPIS